MFSKIRMKKSTEDYSDNVKKLKSALYEADALILGAGSGLSTAAGYTYYKEMTVNLRADDSFVEDAGWHQAAGRYADFIRRHENGNVLYLELGVGMNTPMLCSLRTRTTTTKALIKRRNSEHLQILTTNYEERRCA